jgi:hypothetical protein
MRKRTQTDGADTTMRTDASTLDWLTRMDAMLTATHRYKAASRDRLAPDFNVLRFLRDDENGLSNILADLLDPRGSHGQGGIFLMRFAAQIVPDWNVSESDCAAATIETEHRTNLIGNARRRIDILVCFGKQAILGIENKLWDAPDQERQVSDYIDHLKAKRQLEMIAGHRLLYLARRPGSHPSEHSIDATALNRINGKEDHSLDCIDASHLLPWLSDCIGACKSERVRFFLGEFANYIQTDLLGARDMDEQQLIVEYAVQDARSIANALQVAAAGEAIRKKVLGIFTERLQARLTLPIGWVVDHTEKPGSADTVRIRSSGMSKYGLVIQFSDDSKHYAFIGIAALESADSNLDDVRDALVEALGKSPYKDAEWPWWASLNLPHWRSRSDAMASVCMASSENLVDRAAKKAMEILDVLKHNSLLHRLE